MSRDKIVTITAPRRAELLPDRPAADPIGADEVAGRTAFSLISTGTELNYNYLGTTFPSHPGYAAAFRVEAVGSDVHDIAPGSMAFCLGPHRTFQRVRRSLVVPIPDGLRPDHAVFARLMCVTMSTLTTTTARPPQTVIVTGLGPVGLLGALIFQSCGYRVIGCDPSEARQSLASQAGVRDVRPSVPLGDPDVEGKAALVLECAGHEAAALDGCKVVRKRGEVVLVGVPWTQKTDLTAHELLHAVFHRYAVVRSGWEWEVPLHETDYMANSIYGNIAAAMKWLAEGRLDVSSLYALADPADCDSVYDALLNQTWPRVAAVFDWSQAG